MSKLNKVKPLRILHYEDEKEGYADSFKLTAQLNRIIVDWVDNVDDLVERLEENPKKYNYVVLDAKAYNQEGQLPGTENEMNLIRVFRELERIQSKHQIKIPRCINTGQADVKLRISGSKIVDCRIFDKGNEQELCDYIWTEYEKTEEAQTDFKYPDVFEFAASHFTDADKEHLYELYNKDKYSSVSIADRVVNLANLRRAAESLMIVIHNKYLGGYPQIANNRRLGEVADHLNKEGLIPIHLYGVLTNIRKTANQYGSHPPGTEQELAEYPSADLISGYALGLKDVFKWAKGKLNC
jgi:hypothetical protein